MSLEANENIYKGLLDILSNGKKAVTISKFKYVEEKNQYSRKDIIITEDELTSNNNLNLGESLYEDVLKVIESGNLKFNNNEDDEITLIEPYIPEPKLIVFGGGHISKPLVEFASKVGFSVTVIDDRPSFANPSRFPDAESVICESFEGCFKLLNLNNSSFVVIVTRGHRHDMFCLKESLKYDTAYLGMIGSKRRVKIVKEELLMEGYPQHKISRVNAPIGLDINAVSPEEIAISILAQLISYRRTKRDVNGIIVPGKVNNIEFNGDIIEELVKENNEPKAMVTVVSTKGSVPRKSGAKMIVYLDGRTVGSIGGGCAEGDVINIARDVIRNGGYEIQEVDMTGQVAEEEGMVCGGIMEVFIEAIVS